MYTFKATEMSLRYILPFNEKKKQKTSEPEQRWKIKSWESENVFPQLEEQHRLNLERKGKNTLNFKLKSILEGKNVKVHERSVYAWSNRQNFFFTLVSL